MSSAAALSVSYSHIASDASVRPAAGGTELERLKDLLVNIANAHLDALKAGLGGTSSDQYYVAQMVCQSFCDGLMEVLISEGSTASHVATNPKNVENKARLQTLQKQQKA